MTVCLQTCHSKCSHALMSSDSAKLISCTVEFRKDTWTVFGQCSIQKTHSSQKRYRCEWIQIKEVSTSIYSFKNNIGQNFVSDYRKNLRPKHN